MYSASYSTDISIGGGATISLALPVTINLGIMDGASLAAAMLSGTVNYTIEGTFHAIEVDGVAADFILPLYESGSVPSTMVDKYKSKMHRIIVFIIFSKSLFLFGQVDSVLFDKNFQFNDGVYTSHRELLRNDPKYILDSFELKADWFLGKRKLYYSDKDQNKRLFEDKLFAIVENGAIFILYNKRFGRLILKGSVSTFFMETKYFYNGKSVHTQSMLFFIDLKTGAIRLLNPKNLNWVIKRDSELYESYSKNSESKKKKILYSFILKYNQRNPFYIKTEKKIE